MVHARRPNRWTLQLLYRYTVYAGTQYMCLFIITDDRSNCCIGESWASERGLERTFEPIIPIMTRCIVVSENVHSKSYYMSGVKNRWGRCVQLPAEEEDRFCDGQRELLACRSEIFTHFLRQSLIPHTLVNNSKLHARHPNRYG